MRHMKSAIIIFSICLIVAAYPSCRSPVSQGDAAMKEDKPHSTSSEPLRSILSDFAFIVNCPSESRELPEHGMESKPIPANFELGQKYIFHHRSTDNDELLQILQERLRANKINILSADKLAWRNVGGLLFRITFQSGSAKGYIENEPDRQILGNSNLSSQWSVDDYILRLEQMGKQSNSQ